MTSPDSSRRVLIADDDEDMRELLHMVLTAASYAVVGAASDGPGAVELWRKERTEGLCAVILDERMPGMCGIEVAAAIRSEDPDQTVILFSAYIDDVTIQRAEQAGIAACIPKQDVLSLPAHPVLKHACGG